MSKKEEKQPWEQEQIPGPPTPDEESAEEFSRKMKEERKEENKEIKKRKRNRKEREIGTILPGEVGDINTLAFIFDDDNESTTSDVKEDPIDELFD